MRNIIYRGHTQERNHIEEEAYEMENDTLHNDSGSRFDVNFSLGKSHQTVAKVEGHILQMMELDPSHFYIDAIHRLPSSGRGPSK